MTNEHENLIDVFIGNLDFDDMLKWLDLMEIDNEPPPIDDMYPDWEAEKKTELMEALCKLLDFKIGDVMALLEKTSNWLLWFTKREKCQCHPSDGIKCAHCQISDDLTQIDNIILALTKEY